MTIRLFGLSSFQDGIAIAEEGETMGDGGLDGD